MAQADIEKKRSSIIKWTKRIGVGLAVVLALGVAAPLLIAGVQAGLVILAGGAVAALVINITPVVAFRLANWKLKQIKAEASRNPVETLQNDYLGRKEKLALRLQAIERFAGAVANFKDKLATFKKRWPAEADKFDEKYAAMRKLLDVRKEKFQQAKQFLAEYALEIEKAGAIWEMGQEAAKMDEAAGMSEDDFFAEIKVKTAIESVQRSFNDAMAQLETSLMDEGEDAAENRRMLAEHVPPPRLVPGGPADVIDVSPAKVEVSNGRERR